MKILGLESSGMTASVALVENETLLAEYTVNYKKTHSQTLLPMLDEVRNSIELDLQQIDAIAISSGPGSFTGLRIGSATAKGLGLALGKPLVEVPTLEALAYQCYGAEGLICPLMDARRSQVYTGIYAFEQQGENAQLKIVRSQNAVDIYEILDTLNELQQQVLFLGDGVSVYREIIRQKIEVPYLFAPASCNLQRAAAVAALGAVYFSAGKVVSAAQHQPQYLRKSQAEREALEKKRVQ